MVGILAGDPPVLRCGVLRDEDKVGGARHRLLGPIVAGALVVLVSYSGPMFIIQEAARNAGLSAGQASSWIFTVSVGSGVAGLVLSVLLRQPIVVAFSSAGAVLLSSSLGTYRYGDAIGAYLVVSLACVAIGLSSTFGRLMARVPAPIVSAMLAGVLFRFGTGYFAALPGSPARARVTVLVALMGATYFVARSRGSRLTIVWTALVGVVATVALRLTTGASVALAVVRPEATPDPARRRGDRPGAAAAGHCALLAVRARVRRVEGSGLRAPHEPGAGRHRRCRRPPCAVRLLRG